MLQNDTLWNLIPVRSVQPLLELGSIKYQIVFDGNPITWSIWRKSLRADKYRQGLESLVLYVYISVSEAVRLNEQ